jgi:hypothetical protein
MATNCKQRLLVPTSSHRISLWETGGWYSGQRLLVFEQKALDPHNFPLNRTMSHCRVRVYIYIYIYISVKSILRVSWAHCDHVSVPRTYHIIPVRDIIDSIISRRVSSRKNNSEKRSYVCKGKWPPDVSSRSFRTSIFDTGCSELTF